jgi:hypothetical protein
MRNVGRSVGPIGDQFSHSVRNISDNQLDIATVWCLCSAPYHIQKRSWPSEHAEPEEQSLP